MKHDWTRITSSRERNRLLVFVVVQEEKRHGQGGLKPPCKQSVIECYKRMGAV